MAAEHEPPLFLPLPRKLVRHPDFCRLADDFPLEIFGYRRSKEVLADLLAAGGLRPRAREHTAEGVGLVWGRPLAGAAAEAEHEISALFSSLHPRQREQAYVLRVTPEGMVARGGGEAGLFYAVVTLAHLLSQAGEIPCLSLADWPDFPARAVLLDVSRGRVPSLASLFELVDLLALLKFNQLTFNIEHTFSSPGHPEIGGGHDPLSPDEIKQLVEYAEDRQVELIPFQQSLGHLRHLLEIPRYRPLAYDPEKLWSLDPGRPEIYDLLRGLYAGQVAVTRSKLFHAGCDEPFDLFRRFDPGRFSGRTLGRVIRDHLIKLHEILAEQGRTMMAWADAVLAHPEILPDLPTDLVLCHWSYGTGNLEGPEHYRPALDLLQKSGRPFYACTCTWSMMKIFPDLAVMRQNHESFVPLARQAGAQGLMITIWGDMGHMNLTGLEPYPLAYASRHAWEEQPHPLSDFGRAFAWTVYRDTEGLAGKLAETLDQVNRLLAGPAGMGGAGFLLFFQEPLSLGPLSSEPSEKRAAELAEIAHTAEKILARLEARNLPRPSLWQDHYLPPAQIRVLAKKLELSAFLKANWDQTSTGKGEDHGKSDERAGLAGTAARLCEEAASQTALAFRLLEQRWLANSKPSDLSLNQARYRRLLSAWQERACQFHDFAEKIKTGGAPPPLSLLLFRSPSGYSFNPLEEMELLGLL